MLLSTLKKSVISVTRSCVLLTLACALAVSANAQFVQQGGKLVASDAAGLAGLGFSVAVSADGNTAIVGGPGDNGGLPGGVGAAWVYTRAGGVWTQQGKKLVASDAVGGGEQGYAVAISADGNTAIVGGFADNNNAGAAWVYTRAGGVWSQQGKKLVASDADSSAQQGGSVALSGDGNTALVGGWGDNNGTGAAWVYTRSGSVWTQQGNKLVGTGAVGSAFQGWSVALSADGNTALVGGDNDNPGVCGGISCAAGAAWVYTRSGGKWSQQGSKLFASDESGSAFLGTSAALSSDGNTAILGGPCDGGQCPPGVGAAWVFTRLAGVWSQQGGKLVASDAAGPASQGCSVALSADGNVALVGGDFDGNSAGGGAAWVYTRSGGVWTQQGGKLVGTGEVGVALQGASVALSGDGNTALVGGPGDNGSFPAGAGAAWVFAVPPGTAAPAVITSSSSIAASSATLGASVNPNGSDTHVWFLYSTSRSMSGAISTPQQDIGSGTAALPVSATAGLAANTTYYFQAVAQNGAGTRQGSILNFTTTGSAPLPTAGTSAATSITGSSATLGGTVNPNGSDTHVWFLYGTNNTMSGAVATSQQDIGSGTVAVPISANIAGLAANTLYYFQAAAQNGAGTTQGSILSFTTTGSAAPPTVVSAVLLPSIGSSSATVSGSVNPNGSDTHVWFLYSTNSSMSGALSTPQQDAGSGTVGVLISANLTGLAANTTYYIQAVAQNAAGTSQGLVVSFTTLSSTPTVFVQQGSKLVGTGAVGNSAQGAVAVSADGNTALVGGSSDNNNAGATWVYTRLNGVWTQQGGKLVGSGAVGGAVQGASVALSADGTTALIGGPWDNNYTGAAWVYTRSGSVWTQQGGKLVGTGAVGGARQGGHVALSADGNTAIVGGPDDNNSAGAAWVYTRTGGVWTQQGGKLTGSGAAGYPGQGSSVALSADGSTAIVGGQTDNYQLGAAWVFTRTAGVWTQQGGKLTATDATQLAWQGSSVALSGDGNTAIVGAVGDNGGATRVYTRTGGVWTQQGGKLVGSGAVGGALQGASVSVSTDGNTVLVGGPDDSAYTGAAWVFTRTGGVWTQQGGKLTGTGAVKDASGWVYQGQSVALSGDGNTALIGATHDNGVGAAWVFLAPPTIRAQDGVVNGASFASSTIAPGTFMTIFGTNLASTTGGWNPVNGQLPTVLDGTSVLVNGRNAYVNYVSPGQINFLAPAGSESASSLQVISSNGTSSPVSVHGGTFSPALFMFYAQGNFHYAIATLPDNAYAIPSTLVPGAFARAAKPGDVVAFWATGFGPTTPAYPEGGVVTVQNRGIVASPVTVTIGGKNAAIDWSGIAGAGLYQVNAHVPAVPAGDNAVVITVGGVPTQAGAYIYVGN